MSETKEWIRMAEKAVLDGDYLKSISLSLLVLMWDVSEGSDGMKFKRGSKWSPPCNDWMVKCDKCKGRADVLHADLSGDNLCGGCSAEHK